MGDIAISIKQNFEKIPLWFKSSFRLNPLIKGMTLAALYMGDIRHWEREAKLRVAEIFDIFG